MTNPRTAQLRLALAALSLLAAHALAGPLAYVSNEGGGVSVVDLDRMSVVGTLDTGGQGPRGIGVSADGKFLVTANKGTSDISLIDVASGAVVRRIPVGKNVEFMRVRGNFAYVTYEPSGPGAPPEGGGKGVDGAPAKAASDEDLIPAEIAVVDLGAGTVVRSMKAGRETEGIEFSLDGTLMLVANEGENTVTVYDRESGAVLHKIDVAAYGSRPRGIKVSPDGSHYAVTLEFSDKVLLVDRDYHVVNSASTRKAPYGVSFDAAGRRLYVAAARASVIQVFDATSLALLGEIPVGARCWHFALTPDGKRLIAACGKSNTLVIADTDTLQVLKTLSGVKGPWGVVTYPRARGSIDTP